MPNVKVVLDIDGIRQIRLLPEVYSLVDSAAHGIASRAGEGFVGDTIYGKNRVQGAVKTTSKEAYFRAIHNHTLSKCIR